MEDYKKIKELVKSSKYRITHHARLRFIDFQFDECNFPDCIQRSIILPAKDVDMSEEQDKYFCISKCFFEWVTFVAVLYTDFVVVKTFWPSKSWEIDLYKKIQSKKGEIK